jgi:CubicO group peptidase (beta-lactamase class C family)
MPSYGYRITLRQMLHHASGYRDLLDLLQLAGRNIEDVHSTGELLDLITRQRALNYTPGDRYLYSNTNYWLMALVIQRATGKPLSQFAAQNIFKPLGMSDTRFYDDRAVVVRGRVPAYEQLAAGGFAVGWSTNFEQVGDG